MKNIIITLLHLGFWLCYFLVILLVVSIRIETGGILTTERINYVIQVVGFMIVIPSIISFYTYYFYLFPRFLKKNKIALSIIYGLLIVAIAPSIGYVGIPQHFLDTCGKEGGEYSLTLLYIFMSFVALICGVIALVIQGFINWFEEVKLKEALNARNQEMEMALLKAQLDPHFLFNTINNIDVLILKDVNRASDYINKLSEIIRFALYETKTGEIALSKEIAYIEKYIELQKIRTANTNYVNFNVSGDYSALMIPPMLFIPFIENAFKYTTNKKLDSAIDISIRIEDNQLVFECKNKFDSNRVVSQEHNGLGNTLIKKRLNLLYPNRHNLKLTNENNIYWIHLVIYHETT